MSAFPAKRAVAAACKQFVSVMKLKLKSQYVFMNMSRRKQKQSFFNLRLNIYAQQILAFPTKRKAASDCKQEASVLCGHCMMCADMQWLLEGLWVMSVYVHVGVRELR